MRRRALAAGVFVVACAGHARADEPVSDKPSDVRWSPPLGPYRGPPAIDEEDRLDPARAALRWKNQIRESFIEYSPLWITQAHGGNGKTTEGWDVAAGFTATPNLRWWRLGGSYSFRFRSLDDKTYLLGSYFEMTVGTRWGATEIYSFAGVDWLDVGASHAKLAIGGLSPRVGGAAGFALGFLAVHVYAASEYNLAFTGFDDYRATLVGVRASLLSIGE